MNDEQSDNLPKEDKQRYESKTEQASGSLVDAGIQKSKSNRSNSKIDVPGMPAAYAEERASEKLAALRSRNRSINIDNAETESAAALSRESEKSKKSYL